MALLNILHFPDPRLRTVAKPVTEFDDSLRQLVRDMFETMYEAPGIGLAATQVDHHIRMLVMDVSEGRSQPRCLINPQILIADGEEEMEEGCLSVPGYYEPVIRFEGVRVKALNQKGEPVEAEYDGLLSVCIQHECDHLDGCVYVDRMADMKSLTFIKEFETHVLGDGDES